jgi:hypothetical protein
MFRPGVLLGRTIAVTGAHPSVTARLEAQGAAVVGLDGARPDTLVVDAAPAFADAAGGYDGLRAGLDGAWAATRTVAAAHWIDTGAGGQVVLLAPPAGSGRLAGALAAGLENLARTLGTEWARHRVTTVAVLPGARTERDTVADLVAWLASPAGAYLTGTALTLDRAR